MTFLSVAAAALLSTTAPPGVVARPSSAPVDAGVSAGPPAKPPPSDSQCGPLPALKAPWSFGPGESLEYDLDAVGAKAGTMTLSTLPVKNGTLPIQIDVQTNTFFSKIRRVHGTALSTLSMKTLRPVRYLEDTLENEVHRVADVSFRREEPIRSACTPR